MRSTSQSAANSINDNRGPALQKSLGFFLHGGEMSLPDISDSEKMALIGRQTVLRRARRDAAGKIRDVIVPICNSFESGRDWDLSGIVALVEEINAINRALDDLS